MCLLIENLDMKVNGLMTLHMAKALNITKMELNMKEDLLMA